MVPPESGFLNIYKRSGPTSYDCIRALKRVYKDRGIPVPRMGHLGTLDPLAEGVLPVAIGPARRLISFFKADKVYLATIRLGLSTDTDDIEGQALETSGIDGLSEPDISSGLTQFKGEIDQVPPRFSAVSADGVKAYKRARTGEVFELKPKRVTVHDAELLRWEPPDLVARFRVGPGTYIRSIARDLGDVLDVGGCLAALKRESDGPFKAEDAVTVDELEKDGTAGKLFPLDFILEGWPRMSITGPEGEAFSQGKALQDVRVDDVTDDGYIAVYDEKGFLGIGKKNPDGFLKAKRVLRVDI
jgi:tRNA pseudouridine55 synthase